MLKPTHDLTERDFLEHPVWAEYYEPDDIAALVDLGFNESEVRAKLEQIGYSDEYAFPLPASAADEPFHYLFLAVRATTRGGKQLVGFATGACLAFFHDGQCYRFNSALHELGAQPANALAGLLGEATIFPVRYEVVATGERAVYHQEQPKPFLAPASDA